MVMMMIERTGAPTERFRSWDRFRLPGGILWGLQKWLGKPPWVSAARPSEACEVAAYYIVAECVTNAQKYAEAKLVRVAVSRADGKPPEARGGIEHG